MKRPGYKEEIGSFLEEYLVRPGLPPAELRRAVLLVAYLLVLIPVLGGLAIKALVAGESGKATVISAYLVVLLVQLAWLRFGRHPMILFRVIVAVSMISVGRAALAGGQESLVFLWLYVLPPLLFFLFGRKEGAWWISASYLLAAVLFSSPFTGRYDAELRIAFLVTYLVLALLSYALEAAREGHLEQLLVEKEALAEALAQVQTLQGLLPICASCKRVRDDSGYWSQIESYLESYPEVELQHALCTRCEKDETVRDVETSPAEPISAEARANLDPPPPRATRTGGDLRWPARLGISVALAGLAYCLVIGAFDGFSFLWLYLFPLLGFYVFGRREGTIWAVAALATGIVFLAGLVGSHEEPRRALLFSITYSLVTVIASALESSRVGARERLEAETKSLQRALARVRTLRGLLPICPACKRVRDGEGYWGQIEDYLAAHVDTSFSHGLCPACADEFLADLDSIEEEIETFR